MPKKFAIVTNAAQAGKAAEILVHGPIGKSFWSDEGISGKEFTDALNAIPVGTKVEVGVNSQGGAVGEGLAIYNAIKRRSEDVTVRIDGYALSIASFFPLAASRVVSPKSSIWMIHKAWNFAQGNADQLRKDAELLDTHDEVLAGEYMRKTGKSRNEIEAALSAETWLTGAEAVAWGLADEETNQEPAFAPVDLACYRNPPSGLVAAALRGSPINLSQVIAKPTAQNIANSGAKTTQDTMKDKIKALLLKHGVTVADDATEETIHAELDKLVVAGKVKTDEAATAKIKDQPANVVSVESFNALKAQNDTILAQLASEKKVRITREVEALIDERPSQTGMKADWITRAVADETVLAFLRGMPVEAIGAPPMGAGRIENLGNPIIEGYNKFAPRMAYAPGSDGLSKVLVPTQDLKNASDRIKYRKAHAVDLAMAMDRHMPRAANTISSTLKPDALIDALIVVANNRLAPIAAFSRLFTPDTLRPGATLQVKHATAGSTGQSNPSSWESGDSTLAPISVSLAHKTQSFQISQSDANYGFGLDDLAQVNANAFSNLLSDVYTAIMTTANYGTALSVGAAAAFDSEELKPVLAAAKNYRAKNLILDGGHLAYLLPTNKEQFALGEQGAYGFDLIAEQNRWTSAATNAVGFVCAPDALAVGAGAPASVQSSQFEMYGTFQIAELGLTVLYTVWFNTATRIRWASYEVMFGAAAGDTTQAEVLVV